MACGQRERCRVALRRDALLQYFISTNAAIRLNRRPLICRCLPREKHVNINIWSPAG